MFDQTGQTRVHQWKENLFIYSISEKDHLINTEP